MQLVQVDALQHDVIIADRENDVAVILPNLNVPVVQLAGILEFQLIDP
jgi:dihydroorotase